MIGFVLSTVNAGWERKSMALPFIAVIPNSWEMGMGKYIQGVMGSALSEVSEVNKQVLLAALTSRCSI